MAEYELETTSEYITASVQYNDATGTAAADVTDRGISVTDEVSKLLGVDREEYWPIRVSFFLHERAKDPFISVSLFAVEVKKAGRSYEEVERYLRACQGNPEVVQFSSQGISLDQFFRVFKRFNVVLQHRGLNVEGMKVVRNVEIESPANASQ